MLRCPTCPKQYNCVPGDGPKPSPIMAIGEAPGKDEDRVLIPFIGKSGREWNENYLQLAGLHRPQIYVTNTVKCRPHFNKTPSEKEVWGCADFHLPDEIRETQPEVVFLLGATACSLLGDIDLEAEHGIPRIAKLYDWTGWIVPMYHPAAGLHDTAMMAPIMEDWEKLRPWLFKDEWVWPAEDLLPRDYKLISTPDDVDAYGRYVCRVDQYYNPIVAVDSESQEGKPFSIQYAVKPKTARMILMENTEALYQFSKRSRYMPITWIFHHLQSDVQILRDIGVVIESYRDTMQEAYHLSQPQSLKVLSRRLLGRQRKSWKDVVTPPSKEKLYQWLFEAWSSAMDSWTTTEERISEKTGKRLKPKVIRSHCEKITKELMGYMLKNPDYPIWEKIVERLDSTDLQLLEALLGPYPKRGIAHVPIEQAIDYGCSDADDTLSVALEFDLMARAIIEVVNVQPKDVDVRNVRFEEVMFNG